jgi:hypothetical protein
MGDAAVKKFSLFFLLVISIVFTVSCVSKEVPVADIYYETEYKTENTPKTETVTEALYPIDVWYTGQYYHIYTIVAGVIDGKITATSPTNSNIAFWNLSKVDIERDMWTWYYSNPASYSSMSWPDEGILLVSYLNYVQRTLTWDRKISIDLDNINRFAILSMSNNPPNVSVAGTRTTIATHEVPIQVKKQRLVMQTKKVPFWETIFDDNAWAKVGDRAPEFVLQTVDDSIVSLSDFRGKTVILHWWCYT